MVPTLVENSKNFCVLVLKVEGISIAKNVLLCKGSTEIHIDEDCTIVLPVIDALV